MGDTGSSEGLGQGGKLRVGAYQHGKVGPAAPGSACRSQLPCDVAGLLDLVGMDCDGGDGPVGPGGHQCGAPLIAAVAQHLVGHREDLRRRAIVAGEADRGRFLEIPGHVHQVARVGPVPGIDRLMWVADHGEVSALAHPCRQQLKLAGVDVLKLVDEQEPVHPLTPRGVDGVGAQVAGGQAQEVIEVHNPLATLVVDVGGHDLGHAGGVVRRIPAGGRCGGRIILRLDAAGVGPFDFAHHVQQRCGGALPADASDHAQLGRDQLGGSDTPFRPALTELGPCDRVERAGLYAVAKAELAQPAAQFGGGLACERDGQHRPWVDGSGGGLVGDAPGEHAGFTRPGTGQDAEAEGLMGGRFPLLGIEAGDQSIRLCG